MNRELFARMGVAAAIAAAAMQAQAKDAPQPNLTLDPIIARNLLAPIDDGRRMPADYRLDPGFDPAFGQRAKLSVGVGDTTVFAITGRLTRQPLASGPLDASNAKALGHRRDSGKVYGAGISRSVRGIDLSATYQYSKVTAGQVGPDSEAGDNGPGKSHSLRAMARIRFKP